MRLGRSAGGLACVQPPLPPPCRWGTAGSCRRSNATHFFVGHGVRTATVMCLSHTLIRSYDLAQQGRGGRGGGGLAVPALVQASSRCRGHCPPWHGPSPPVTSQSLYSHQPVCLCSPGPPARCTPACITTCLARLPHAYQRAIMPAGAVLRCAALRPAPSPRSRCGWLRTCGPACRSTCRRCRRGCRWRRWQTRSPTSEQRTGGGKGERGAAWPGGGCCEAGREGEVALHGACSWPPYARRISWRCCCPRHHPVCMQSAALPACRQRQRQGAWCDWPTGRWVRCRGVRAHWPTAPATGGA